MKSDTTNSPVNVVGVFRPVYDDITLTIEFPPGADPSRYARGLYEMLKLWRPRENGPYTLRL